MEYIFHLEAEEGIALISKAFEKHQEDKAFQLYLSKYPYMTEKTYIPFHEFYNPQKQTEYENKSETEILSEVKVILDSYQGGE
ncbi:hypothetical protein [Cytobacillus praedii]|uniref:Uncharacterized protein n=1 Tax=Cytobacillus praedii TaxID=1742358 RepID=A0A4R1AX56_9BACI|nr:hypothetical protein [Cytobacillus praedii]TCJ05042.1 hypothetical protein E0Y62_07445 [Cytobacillus praedii]